MGIFLEKEKERQKTIKAESELFSKEARSPGLYKGAEREFCLPRHLAHENVFAGVRSYVLDYFKSCNIHWHDGGAESPSNHLCDSQVCCVNFLAVFARQPAALASILRRIYPTVTAVIPIERQSYVAFEWIGAENYLGEKIKKDSVRTRGANFTSADAAVLTEHGDGSKRLILIEWKYTESYSGNNIRIAKSGTNRGEVYAHLYDSDDCPINKALLPSYDALFYEPFYQFMRQQFLAHEMEKAKELGADIVSVLHIAPGLNADFYRITSPQLLHLGSSATQVWAGLLLNRDRFISVTTDRLFSSIDCSAFPELYPWSEYIKHRYAPLLQSISDHS